MRKFVPIHIVTLCLVSIFLLLGNLPGCGCPTRRPTPSPAPTPTPAPTPAPKAKIVGIITAFGNEVKINKQISLRDREEREIFEGDEVLTGPSSNAIVDFTGGGSIDIDENTDPIFRLIEQGACILIKMFYGQAHLDSQNRCIEAETPEAWAFLNSRVNIKITVTPVTIFTVIEGKIAVVPIEKVNILSERNHYAVNSQFEVSKDRIISSRVLTEAEIESVDKWRTKLLLPPVRPPDRLKITP